MTERISEGYEYEHAACLIEKAAKVKPLASCARENRRKYALHILNIGIELGMSSRGIQLAISYFDLYFARKGLPEEGPKLLMFGCLSLAYSIDEVKELTQSQILKMTKNKYSNLNSMKINIMLVLEFHLEPCTATDVIGFFYERLGNCQFHFKQAEQLANISYLNYDLINQGPLLIAAATSVLAFRILADSSHTSSIEEVIQKFFQIEVGSLESCISLLENPDAFSI